jgi:hypothetical protein
MPPEPQPFDARRFLDFGATHRFGRLRPCIRREQSLRAAELPGLQCEQLIVDWIPCDAPAAPWLRSTSAASVTSSD